MLVKHIAAILLFSGPLLYLGLWMMLDPAGFATLPGFLARVSRKLVQSFVEFPAQQIVESEDAPVSPPVRTAVRLTGVVLVLFAIVL